MLKSTPSTEEVTMNLELPSQEEQGTTVTPMYLSRDKYKIATTPRKERKPKESVVTYDCSGRIEMVSTSTLTSKEGIPIIKEQAMLTPKFLGQAESGPALALMTKEVTVTLELLSQVEQGTTVTPTYSSREEYKIATIPRKERKPKEVVVTFECSD